MRARGFQIAALVLVVSAAAFGADFMGPESCKACHPAAYDAWKQSKHARAAESLSPTQRKDPRCMSCHTPDVQDEKVTGVSCETCHGGGQYYSAPYVMKDSELARLVGLQDPSERTCRACHDASSPSLKPFNFVEKLKKIDHWSAAVTKPKVSQAKTAPESKELAAVQAKPK